MLTGLRLGNFKAFAETQRLPVRPLTLSQCKSITHRIGCQGVVMGLYFPHDFKHAGTSDQSQV